MKTNVYVDAFNLYYGCCKNTPYRWLDIAQLCRLNCPGTPSTKSATSRPR